MFFVFKMKNNKTEESGQAIKDYILAGL